MIKNWSEIQERYDAIKDHKPRASKKLNELGEILSSAYMLDPDKADQMWQYIVDLNVADDITFSKFYIAQVFNKLTDRMKPEDATAFLAMNPERLQMMIMYGYDGGTLWRCLDTLMRGYIAFEDVNGAMLCVSYFYDKFGGINSGYPDIYTVAGNVANICVDHIRRKEQAEMATELLTELGKSENDDVNSYFEIIKAINEIGGPFDYESLLESALENRHPTEFFDLLWVARNDLDEEALRDKWVKYVQGCDEDEIGPWNYIREDDTDYRYSKVKFYVDLEKETDELLEYFFASPNLHDVEKGIIWTWFEEGDLNRFVKYLSKTLMCTSEENFSFSSIKYELKNYMDESFLVGPFGKTYDSIMKDRKRQLAEALSSISAITIGCEAHESFHAIIRNYIQREFGSIDILNAAGFNDKLETRTAEERLKDYIHSFLISGKALHQNHNVEYSLIKDALDDEYKASKPKLDLKDFFNTPIDKIDDFMANYDEDKEDYKWERKYRFAQDEEITEFYFHHCPDEYYLRESMISSCVRKGDINRAIELIDMMADTKDNEGYNVNDWGWKNRRTMESLIDEYAYKKGNSWNSSGESITDEMREIVRQLVYRAMRYLPQEAAEKLREDSLYKIDPQSEDTDEYIMQLLEDTDAYIAFAKNRRQGGAVDINRISNRLNQCFEHLSKMGRLDVVAEIMGKLAIVGDDLKPVRFSTWMSTMTRELKHGELIKIFRINKGIFEAWLSGDGLRDWDILNVARGIVDGCTRAEFMEFRNLVISRRGKVDGLDACYQATSENTETQEMFDGETAKISLDYINIGGSRSVSFISINLLTTAKTRKLDSVRLLKCVINGIGTTDCGFISEMDEEPKIGYKVFRVNEESHDSLTIYSEFFEKNSIDEVNKIVLQFAIMDDDVDVIEEVSDVVIELDNVTGEYKVTQKAKSLNCFINIDEEEEEYEGDIDRSVIDFSVSQRLLQGRFSSDGNEQVEEDTIEFDSDNFSDITIYEDDQGVIIDFCGIEFDEDKETISLIIWCSNHTDEKRELWLDNLIIDGENRVSIQLLGTIEANDCDFFYFEISDIAYSLVDSVDFEVEVDDTDNTELGRTRHVSLELDTGDESFKGSVTGTAVYTDSEEGSNGDVDEDGDEFEDITIYEDDQGVSIDFCGIEFEEDNETITLSIWCSNRTDKKRKLWLDNLIIDGEKHISIQLLGTIEANNFDFFYYEISSIDYSLVDTIDFEVEVDDTDNTELGRTRHVSLEVDTSDETFKVSVTGTAVYSDSEEGNNGDVDEDGEEFEDITIYDEDDVQVDFCGAEFDSVDEVITLSIWCDSSCDETRRFWITDVKVNGMSHGTIEKLGDLDEYGSEYFESVIESVDGIPYENIQSVEFSVEVDDSDNNELGRSQIVRIIIDTDEESFQVGNIESRSYSDSYDNEEDEEIELKEDDDNEEELLSQIDAQLKNLVQADIKMKTHQDIQADTMDSLQEQINKLLGN